MLRLRCGPADIVLQVFPLLLIVFALGFGASGFCGLDAGRRVLGSVAAGSFLMVAFPVLGPNFRGDCHSRLSPVQ